eukprot:scaffold31741_cov66-Phaeocystis_antarctica.AAC.3
MILRLAPTRLPDRAVVGPLGLERERRHVLARGQALDEQHDRQPPVVAVPVEQAAGAAATSAAIDDAADRARVGAEHGEDAQARAAEAELRVLARVEQPPRGTLRGAERVHVELRVSSEQLGLHRTLRRLRSIGRHLRRWHVEEGELARGHGLRPAARPRGRVQRRRQQQRRRRRRE